MFWLCVDAPRSKAAKCENSKGEDFSFFLVVLERKDFVMLFWLFLFYYYLKKLSIKFLVGVVNGG